MRKGNRRISQHRRARIRGDRCEKSRSAAPRPATQARDQHDERIAREKSPQLRFLLFRRSRAHGDLAPGTHPTRLGSAQLDGLPTVRLDQSRRVRID